MIYSQAKRVIATLCLLLTDAGLWSCVGIGVALSGTADRTGRADTVLPSVNREPAIDPHFTLIVSPAGIESLKGTQDPFGTEFLLPGRSLGELVLRYRIGTGRWQEAGTRFPGTKSSGRSEKRAGVFRYAVSHSLMFRGRPHLEIAYLFTLEGDSLSWLLRVRNMTDSTLEIGDLAVPLAFNNQYGESGPETFEKRVIRHHYIGGPASFLYWMRPSGAGPYLVMTPKKGSSLEYFDLKDQGKDSPSLFSVYIHSSRAEQSSPRGTWRLGHPSLKLGARGTKASEGKYGFTLRWAADYNGVRDILYRGGLVDVRVVPGMTLPSDLNARIAVRTRQNIVALEPEFPAETRITPAGKIGEDIFLYDVTLEHLGENLLTLRYGDGERMPLEFFATEPLELLIKKRSSFLVANQQHREKEKWYNGLFSQWDMRNSVLRSPDDPDGFLGRWAYVLACDDPALCKAPFLASKNVRHPNAREIKAIEYYINNYVWGRLQYTEKDTPYPYGVFGLPNWYENRTKVGGQKEKGEGLHHVWRTYDYPHLVMLYFHMYQIAKMYPNMLRNADPLKYLERAFGTANAMFTVPEMIFPVHEATKWASYNELLIVDLMDSLDAEGFHEQAERLRSHWEKKVKYFIYDDPYPYQSEYSFDATAYESTEAIAAYALTRPMRPDSNLWYDNSLQRWYSHPVISRTEARGFLERQMAANLACRGTIEPAYYFLGSDYRGESSRFTLSYMSQMGGWAVLDYALRFSASPAEYFRIGYASFLSSWALMNTGTRESGYGYWYPGQENDGAAGWAFEPQRTSTTWIRKEQGRGAWFYDGEIDLGFGGALRAAATIVSDDSLFGLFAYGGTLGRKTDTLLITPRDGVRQRLHVVHGTLRLHLVLERDGYSLERPVEVDAKSSTVRFELENRSGDQHRTTLRCGGLPPGSYAVECPNGQIGPVNLTGEGEVRFALPVKARGDNRYTLHRIE